MTTTHDSRARPLGATAYWLAALLLLGACASAPERATPAPEPPQPAPTAPDTLELPRPPVGVPVRDSVVRPDTVVPPPKPVPVPVPTPPAPEVGAVVGPPLAGSRVPVHADALLPRRRIVAFYGNPASRNMGILGELPPDQMLARLDREVAAWERADPATPVQPALHLIASMAAADPGADGTYRVRMPSRRIDEVLGWAQRRDAILFLDIQPARSTVAAELPRLRPWLERPDVHLGLDPEWNMGPAGQPGHRIGSMTAAEINHAIRFLIDIVEEHDLPPKILVVHRFTQSMVRDAEDIIVDPRVQVVLHMDGWGPPAQKLETYRSIVAPEAEQFTGFKLFYKNDVRGGSRMLRPAELLALRPVPFYIQYQ